MNGYRFKTFAQLKLRLSGISEKTNPTGDIVKAIVTKGKKIGTYFGRVATRASGSFNVSTKNGLVQGINYKYCQLIHSKDGYQYAFTGIKMPDHVHPQE